MCHGARRQILRWQQSAAASDPPTRPAAVCHVSHANVARREPRVMVACRTRMPRATPYVRRASLRPPKLQLAEDVDLSALALKYPPVVQSVRTTASCRLSARHEHELTVACAIVSARARGYLAAGMSSLGGLSRTLGSRRSRRPSRAMACRRPCSKQTCCTVRRTRCPPAQSQRSGGAIGSPPRRSALGHRLRARASAAASLALLMARRRTPRVRRAVYARHPQWASLAAAAAAREVGSYRL